MSKYKVSPANRVIFPTGRKLLNTVPNKIENYLVRNKVIQRSSKPEDVIKKISQILNNHKSVRERQKNAHQLLS